MSDIFSFLAVVAGSLTLLGLFLVFVQHRQSRPLELLKASDWAKRIEALMDTAALDKIKHAILQDGTEELVRFLSADRTPAEAEAFLRDLLYLTAEGLLPLGGAVRVRLLTMAEGRLRTYAVYTPEGVPDFRGSTFAPGEGTPGLAFATRDVVMVKDFAEEVELPEAHKLPFKSVLCVPVPATGQDGPEPIGVLNLDSPQEGYFEADSVRFVSTISNICFLAWNHVYGRR